MPALAAAAGFLLAAFNKVGTPPGPTGANRTVTVHVWPGPRLVPVQVSLVMKNSTEGNGDRLIVSVPVAAPPELVSVNVCDAVCPVNNVPKSYAAGVKASPCPAPRPVPVPTSASVAVAAFLLAAVSVAVTVPDLAGVNRTVTVHVLPGARLLQVSPVMVNAAETVSLTVSRPVADRPELARVNVCEADCRTVTCP
jgi:hypothetical protein